MRRMIGSCLLVGPGCLLATLSAAHAGADAVVPTIPVKVDLVAKTFRTFDVLLPAPQFQPVGSGFNVPHEGGDRFDVKVEGDRLRVDLDGDHATESLVEGESGFVTLTGKSTTGHPIAYSVRLVHPPGEGWNYSCGSAMVGEVAGTRVQVFDQNLNGRFDDVGVDAIVVGKSQVASFLSKAVSIGNSLYGIEVASDGSSLSYAPFAGEAGELDLVTRFECKAELAAAVVTSADGRFSFDVAASKSALRVPVGEYTIHSGQLALGESRASMRTGRAHPIGVRKDETTTVEWGGPATAEFACERKGDTLNFSPWDIWYYGRLGEEYFNFLPLGKSPEFSIKNRLTKELILYAKFPGNC